jgi:hypothetical protein
LETLPLEPPASVVIGRRQRDNIWRFVSLQRRAVIALDDSLRPLNQVGVEFRSPRGLPHDRPQDLLGAVNGYRVRPMAHRRNIQILVHRSDSRNLQPESRNVDRSLLVRAAS